MVALSIIYYNGFILINIGYMDMQKNTSQFGSSIYGLLVIGAKFKKLSSTFSF